MAYIAQRSGRISGTDYAPGDAVPVDAVGSDEYTLVRLGYIAVVPDGAVAGDDRAALVAELEEAKSRLAAAEARLAESGIDVPPAPSFDPGEHTVAEVAAHVDNHPDDLARVRAAEAAGQARKTLLAELDRRLASAEEAADDRAVAGAANDDEATGAEGEAAGTGDDTGGITEVQ